jgi:hypothetical protein
MAKYEAASAEADANLLEATTALDAANTVPVALRGVMADYEAVKARAFVSVFPNGRGSGDAGVPFHKFLEAMPKRLEQLSEDLEGTNTSVGRKLVESKAMIDEAKALLAACVKPAPAPAAAVPGPALPPAEAPKTQTLDPKEVTPAPPAPPKAPSTEKLVVPGAPGNLITAPTPTPVPPAANVQPIKAPNTSVAVPGANTAPVLNRPATLATPTTGNRVPAPSLQTTLR